MTIKLKKGSFRPTKEALKTLNRPNIMYENPFDLKKMKMLELKQKEMEKYLKN